MLKRVTKFVNGIECLYCKEDGNYYPLRKEVSGTEFILDEEHFIYVPPFTNYNEAIMLDAIVEEKENYELSRFYGKAREEFLKTEDPELFKQLQINSALLSHLISIDKEAKEWEDILTNLMCKNENVDETLKKKNQLEWVSQMNNIKNRVREIIQHNLIYV